MPICDGIHLDAVLVVAAAEDDRLPATAGVERVVGRVVLRDAAAHEMQQGVLGAADLGIGREDVLGHEARIEAELLPERLAGLRELLHDRGGLGLLGPLVHLAERRQQDPDEQDDDADHHEQFGDREAPPRVDAGRGER